MLRKNRSVALVVIALVVAISAPAQTDLNVPPSTVIRGSVVDPDQKAVANAKIFAWPMGEIGLDLDAVAVNPERFADRSVSASSTGQDGRFEIVLPDRRYAYHVIALAEGFAPKRIANVSHERDAVDFRLDRGNFVHGIVQDAEGTPLAGADVTYHGILADAKFRRSTKSSADGKFRIELLPDAPNGRYFPHFLLAKTDGRPAAYVGHERLALQKGDVHFFDHGSVAIVVSGLIEGVVTTADGKPVADADVSVLRRSWCEAHTTDSGRARSTISPYLAERIATTKTDADGRYRIDNLPIDLESMLVFEWWPRDGRPVPILEVEKEGVGIARKLFGLHRQSEPNKVDIVIGRDSWPYDPAAESIWESADSGSGKIAADVSATAPTSPDVDPKTIGECILTLVDQNGVVLTDRVLVTYAFSLGMSGPRRLDLQRFAVTMPTGTVPVDVEVGKRGRGKQRFLVKVVAGQSTRMELKIRDASPLIGKIVGDGVQFERAVVIATDESGISVEAKCSDGGAFSFEGLPHGRWSLTAAVVDEDAAFATREPRVLEIGRASDLPVLKLEAAARVAVFVDLSGDDVESRELAKRLSKTDDHRRKKWGRSFSYSLRQEGSDVVIPIEELPEITSRQLSRAQEFGVLLPVPSGRWNIDVSIGGRKLFGGRCDVKAGESTTLTARRL